MVAHIHMHANTRNLTYTNTRTKKNTQAHKHANSQTHEQKKHTNAQTHKRTNTRTQKRRNMQTQKHTNTQNSNTRSRKPQIPYPQSQTTLHLDLSNPGTPQWCNWPSRSAACPARRPEIATAIRALTLRVFKILLYSPNTRPVRARVWPEECAKLGPHGPSRCQKPTVL
jgi:hypothetical protein